MLARAHRCRPGCFVVGPLEHRVFRLERWALRRASGASAGCRRRVERAVQRTEPSAVPRIVAKGRNNEEIARTRRSNVGEPHAFGLIALDFFELMLVQLVRRPAADLHRAQPVCGVEVPARVIAAEAAGQVGKNHDRELEAFRLVHRHQAHAVTALLENRRFGDLGRLRRVTQFLDEAAERDAAPRLVLAGELGDVEHVGKRLLASRPEDEADVRARLRQQPSDGVGDRAVVTDAVKLLQ